ncbi:Amine oxidase [flavin-containing] [Seminavis robusta]|uniref:monoamine oxidase n=1 Tax=Seminavis robusta TaxID=568900 RepID=A0A9N8DWF0_9STRA|nr:Amine oxidase [flavin-containing] [Seminavis robusta]|eukprot:Sro409_g137150.1 Amine oxidase [flavin-containing] (548) ;mRNA; f:18797-20440
MSAPASALDVLIIGAGQAGMAAAHRLLHKGVTNIHVVEAHPHVGGRTRNVDLATGMYDQASDHAVELGGTWLSPNHAAFLGLCQELDIPIFRASRIDPAQAEQGKDKQSDGDDDWPWWYWGPEYTNEEMSEQQDILLFHETSKGANTTQKTRFRTHQQLLAALDKTTLEQLHQAGNMIWNVSLGQQVPDLSWEAHMPGSRWDELDGYTTAAKLMPQLSTTNARNILRQVIHNKNAQEPNQVGYLYNLLSFKGCNSDGPDNEYRVQGGTQAVPLAIAHMLGPDRLTLADPVQVIRGAASGRYQVISRSNKVYTANHLIVTGSPHAIMGLHFDNPPLPGEHAQLLQRMPMGTCRKVMAVYKRGPWWRDHGLTGDIIASHLPLELSVPVDSTHTEDRQPIFPQCYDTSPYSLQYGVITCFVEGRANLYYSSLPHEKQEQLFREFLKLSFAEYIPPGDDASGWDPDEILMHNWADDPFARGAYTGFFGPGVLSEPAYWSAYRQMEKLPNVWIAGADYHIGYGNGYIEGAVRSGQLAADQIHKRMQGKSLDE